MTRNVDVPLDSYRLAQYSVQVPCYICEEGNSFDTELCRHCQAPMALTHQANSQGVSATMIATIGPSGVGKTVYLGMLIDMLSRQCGELSVLARGAFSITLQQTVIASLSRCEFPEKTPNEPDRWNWVHCQVTSPGRKRPIDLIMPDMAGEAIIEEVDHPHTYKGIRALLNKCTGVQILIDAAKLREGGMEQDHFTMKLLTYLQELSNNPKTGWRNRPVAMVFTKADQCEECFDDPVRFAKEYASRLWQHCQQQFKKHKFFAAGVAGACTQKMLLNGSRINIPLRVEPRGITEPFGWLVDNIKA